jgi:transposase
MAYLEVGMWEILDALRRVHRGESYAAIERATSRTRKTVRRYVRLALKAGWQRSGPEPDEALAGAVARALKPGAKDAVAGEAEARLAPHREQIMRWLATSDGGDGEDRGLRLSKVHELLRRQGVEVPYSSLHRFVVRHCGFHDRRRCTVRVADVAPGELVEVDFGKLGLVPDRERDGQRRTVYALIVTLVHSRHQYVHITTSQRIADLIEGIEAAWEFFGGVAARVVLDNLKAAVITAHRYDPLFQRTFEEYARYRGFVIDAAIARHATGKPHVERNVQYLRESFFRGETWMDIAHVQRDAVRWCLEVAGTRTHGTTRQRPLAVFEDAERGALLPLTSGRFDTPSWATCKVHGDHHIQVGRALYSVPHAYLHKPVDVRSDSGLVRIFFGGELIKTHARQPPGGRATDYGDYPDHLAAYAMRDPQRVIAEARRQGPDMGRFTEQLLSGTFPWARLRQAQKLLRLADKYGRARVDDACRRALAFDVLNVHRVERIVKLDLERLGAADTTTGTATGQLVLLSAPRFLRPAGSFTHNPPRKESPSDGSHPVPQDRHEAPQALRDPADAS